MKIRRKIILYFSLTTIALTGLVLFLIYVLFGAYRREEFQSRLQEKITFSLKFLQEVQHTSQSLLNNLDRITINDIYEEKILLFDANKKLIYASLDDTRIEKSNAILRKLGPNDTWIETKEGRFDVIGVFVKVEGQSYYGIYKAYDTFGYTQKRFLAYILWGAFVFISLITLVVTFYLSRQISSPINKMASEMNLIELESGNALISIPDTKDEINYLATRFNELMGRLNNSFAFQRHAIHHISHELKTPIAILVSNFEKMEKQTDPQLLAKLLSVQKEDTRSLGDTINTLLEISKVETNNHSPMKSHRIDDILFDVIAKMHPLDPDFVFKVTFEQMIATEEELMIDCNPKLIRIAFTNLLMNCMRYSQEKEAMIDIKTSDGKIYLQVKNYGRIIDLQERKYLFNYFFRGQNSKDKGGFGLGLVMVYKIMQLHKGDIEYQSVGSHTNIFLISLPLS